MQRLKDWTIEDLNEEQKKVHDEIVNGPRGKVVGPLRKVIRPHLQLKVINMHLLFTIMGLTWL